MPIQKPSSWKHFQPKDNTPGPIEAVLWERIEANRVRCDLCAFRCIISPGHVGVCNVRHNVDGTLYALNYLKATAFHVDPMEKKPLFHFHPGSAVMSVAAPGCNFHCRFCQNSDVSQMPVEYDRIEGQPLAPAWIVEQAIERGCNSIAYTYTEPTIYAEYALEIGAIAKERGLKNIWVTNGYMTAEALDLAGPFIDAANVDLKGMDDKFTLKVCGARHQPVLDTIRRMHDRGIWVEVSSVIIPGYNDDDDHIKQAAEFLASVSPDMPWHLTAFHPDYKMMDVPSTPPESLLRAVQIGKDAGLRHVYTGNTFGWETENTHCPGCGHTVIRRSGFSIREWDLTAGKCGKCAAAIAGVGLQTPPHVPQKTSGVRSPKPATLCG